MVLEADIRAVREKLAMSQEKLAEQLGVTRNTVSRWELGGARPSAKNLIALNRLLTQIEEPPQDTGAEPVVSPAEESPEPDLAPAAPPAEVPQEPADEAAPPRRRNYRLWAALAAVIVVIGMIAGLISFNGWGDDAVPISEIEGKEVDQSLIIESVTLHP